MRQHIDTLSSFVVGLIFGIGLILAGMTNPAKVIGFLDVAGSWDPSLAFVMGGAILVGLVAFRFAHKRTENFFGGAIRLPTSRDIDLRLVGGSLIFGIGWGLAGYCPGPALATMLVGNSEVWLFVPSMLVGGALQRWQQRHTN